MKGKKAPRKVAPHIQDLFRMSKASEPFGGGLCGTPFLESESRRKTLDLYLGSPRAALPPDREQRIKFLLGLATIDSRGEAEAVNELWEEENRETGLNQQVKAREL